MRRQVAAAIGPDGRVSLPPFVASSAGEVRKVDMFTLGDYVARGDGWVWDESVGWVWRGQQGCSDEWLASHPGYGVEGMPESLGQTRRGAPGETHRVRYITWSRDGILSDVTVDVTGDDR